MTKPFEDSPGSTFFRRLSWSPDGAHITASNATNNKGFVFIAAVIARNSWASDISLVGHENTIEVAAYNPHMFFRDAAKGVTTTNICSVVALGADDRSVSIWQTNSARPLIVAKEVFERQIMDLSWSWDGMTLYAVSSDGTIGVFDFDPEELEGIATHETQKEYLQKFNFSLPPVPEGYSHTDKPRTSFADNGTATSPSTMGFGNLNGSERVNVLVAKRGKKKRVSLSAANEAVNGTITAGPASILKRAELMHVDDTAKHTPASTSTSVMRPRSFFDRMCDSWEQQDWEKAREKGIEDVGMDVEMAADVPITAIDSKGKRKASNVIDLTEDGRPTMKARTLGGDRLRDNLPVKEIDTGRGRGEGGMVSIWNSVVLETRGVLPVPPLLTSMSAEVEGSDDVFESRNSEDDGSPEVFFVSGKHTQWLDYLPSPAIAIRATSHFCAVAMLDGCLTVYSHTGRRIMPTLALGSICSFMEASKCSLLVITSIGQLYSWNIKENSCHFPPVSVAPLVTSPNHTITAVAVRSNGCPIINCSNGVALSYDPSLQTFVKLTERWWAEGSDVWQGRQRASTQTMNRGVIMSVEATISGGTPPNEMTSTDDTGIERKQRPGWWNTALTLGHLESRLHAARLLDSPQEFKQAMLVYAKRLSDEGFRGKAEELIRELFGPIYCRPGREESWFPTVAGLPKRDLLKDVLSIFARSKTLTKLALDWQDTLKKAANED